MNQQAPTWYFTCHETSRFPLLASYCRCTCRYRCRGIKNNLPFKSQQDFSLRTVPSSYRTIPRSSSSVKTMCEQKIATRRLRPFRCRGAMTISSYQSNLSCSLPHTTADYTHCRACWCQRVGLFLACRFFCWEYVRARFGRSASRVYISLITPRHLWVGIFIMQACSLCSFQNVPSNPVKRLLIIMNFTSCYHYRVLIMVFILENESFQAGLLLELLHGIIQRIVQTITQLMVQCFSLGDGFCRQQRH